jgi:hypothetical protein
MASPTTRPGRLRHQLALLAALLFAQSCTVDAFTSLRQNVLRKKVSYLSSQANEHQPLDKVETAAVKFLAYDKLCDACPTRLQPRVETLKEMIMGLQEREREELLANVARRVEEGSVSEVCTSRVVYDFQVAAQRTEEFISTETMSSEKGVASTSRSRKVKETSVAKEAEKKTMVPDSGLLLQSL